MSTRGQRETIFEFVQHGAYMRVSAVDVETGTEAVIAGPVNAARSDLETLAMRKLDRLLTQQQQQQ